jgi:hypothetical protein
MPRLGSNNPEHTFAIQVDVSLESHYRLLEWKDLPNWRQDNKFITSSYYTPSALLKKCLRSLKHIHNKIVNIYLHLLGVLLFLGLFIDIL